MRYLATLIFCLGILLSFQAKSQWMIAGGIDAYKTDNSGVAEKVQVGMELNYFLNNNFSVLGGFEIWTGQTYFVPGLRVYPIDPVFIKFKGLIGNRNDISLGMGFWKGLGNGWRLEFTGDYYFVGNLGIRGGLAYRF